MTQHTHIVIVSNIPSILSLISLLVFFVLVTVYPYREELSVVKNENNKLEIRLAGMEGSLSVESEVVQQQQRQLKADRAVVDELQGMVATQATLLAEMETEAMKDKQLAQKLANQVDVNNTCYNTM